MYKKYTTVDVSKITILGHNILELSTGSQKLLELFPGLVSTPQGEKNFNIQTCLLVNS